MSRPPSHLRRARAYLVSIGVAAPADRTADTKTSERKTRAASSFL